MNDANAPAQVTVTRSEEQLTVRTRQLATGRAVLRRVVVTEERTVTVQLRHEEVRFEVIPFDSPIPVEEENQPAHLASPELVLHREELVVTKRIVPVERVRLDVRTITEQQLVTEQLRKERVTFDDGTTTGAAPDVIGGPPISDS